MSTELVGLKPIAAVRRFDVFAEFQKLEALKNGRGDHEARGYGIWLAKVVASRRARRGAIEEGESILTAPRDPNMPPQFHSFDGELQTESVFDHEIVDRMGRDFYQKVFSPAIRAAVEEGKSYVEIRDSIRSSWKPDV